MNTPRPLTFPFSMFVYPVKVALAKHALFCERDEADYLPFINDLLQDVLDTRSRWIKGRPDRCIPTLEQMGIYPVNHETVSVDMEDAVNQLRIDIGRMLERHYIDGDYDIWSIKPIPYLSEVVVCYVSDYRIERYNQLLNTGVIHE